MTSELKAAADRVRRVLVTGENHLDVYGHEDDPQWMIVYSDMLFEDDCIMLARAFVEEHQGGK